MKTYLVTGGAGFIGSNFVHFILNKYCDVKVINLDKLTYAGNLQNLKQIQNHTNYNFVKGDICDQDLVDKLFKESNIDYVVNFAAESHVDRSIKDPEVFVKTNVLGTVALLNAAKNSWSLESGFKEGKKFLQISTDEVYGSLGETGYFVETTPIDSHSPYSSSKASNSALFSTTNNADIKALSASCLMSSLLNLPPVIACRASIINDFPEPVSPVIIFKPAVKLMDSCSMIMKFLILISNIIGPSPISLTF